MDADEIKDDNNANLISKVYLLIPIKEGIYNEILLPFDHSVNNNTRQIVYKCKLKFGHSLHCQMENAILKVELKRALLTSHLNCIVVWKEIDVAVNQQPVVQEVTTLNELKDDENIPIHKKYQFRRTLGKSARGRVVEAIDKFDPNIKLAIKIMDKEKEICKTLYHHEVDILSQLRHKNIVKLVKTQRIRLIVEFDINF